MTLVEQSVVRRSTIGAFEMQAEKPAGGDKYLAAFNTSVVGMLRVESPLRAMISSIEEIRPAMPPSQLVNLVFRAFQYICLEKQQTPSFYPSSSLLEADGWNKLISDILVDPLLSDELFKLLSEKDTTTTIPNRYISLRAVVHSIFGDKPVSVLDMGCSKPLGLDSAGRNDGIAQVEDHTEDFFITQMNTPVQMTEAIGTDITDPFSEEATRWREACGCYPGEIKNGGLMALKKREAEWQEDGIRFVRKDITKNDLSLADFEQTLPFDCVQMATILYQLPPDKQIIAVQNAFSLLKEGGVLIIQDFVELDDTAPFGLKFLSDWGKEEAYKTIIYIKSGDGIMPLDVLHWDSGRCKKVYQGKDFHVLKEARSTI